jgi:hypothetical protein
MCKIFIGRPRCVASAIPVAIFYLRPSILAPPCVRPPLPRPSILHPPSSILHPQSSPRALPNPRWANGHAISNVNTGDNVLIGGIIVGASGTSNVIVRSLGPSLPLSGALADPALELRDTSGTFLQSSDNWKTRPDGSSQQAAVELTTVPPTNDLESALVQTLPLRNYTAMSSATCEAARHAHYDRNGRCDL